MLYEGVVQTVSSKIRLKIEHLDLIPFFSRAVFIHTARTAIIRSWYIYTMLGVLDANRDCGLKRTWDLCLFRAEVHFTPCGLNVVFLVDQPPLLIVFVCKRP